ncbi:hypothetical protein [Streptomyces violens]|uniref:hypothetical protein n=1 Tax=Streptomyces violens TaxID=66377 RepID=UPI0004C23AB1|nr:hypothetical protein [Streptomyces violens]
MAIERCPHLSREDFVVLRARTPKLWGVFGTAYELTVDGWRTQAVDVMRPYGDEGLKAVLASRTVRELRAVAVVDLREVL